jgi:hypothetical protein
VGGRASHSEADQCDTPGEPEGTVVTEPLESYGYEEGTGYITVLGGSPIMSFSCGHGALTLSGTAAEQLSVSVNAPTSSAKYAFGSGLGEQDLQLGDEHGTVDAATLTTEIQIADTQAIELRAAL